MRTQISVLRMIESLHDAEIIGITIDYSKRLLKLEIEDFYANFEGLSNYPGSVHGALCFSQFRDLEIILEPLVSEHERLWIYEAEVSQDDTSVLFAIRFSPAGRISGKAMAVLIDEPSLAWETLLGPPSPNDG